MILQYCRKRNMSRDYWRTACCGILVSRVRGYEEAITAACSRCFRLSETSASQGTATGVQRSASDTACFDRVALRVAASKQRSHAVSPWAIPRPRARLGSLAGSSRQGDASHVHHSGHSTLLLGVYLCFRERHAAFKQRRSPDARSPNVRAGAAGRSLAGDLSSTLLRQGVHCEHTR